MWKLVPLALFASTACTINFGSPKCPPEDHATDGDDVPPDAAEPPRSLDGTWPLERSLVSKTPVPPRTAPCDEGFTTGYQPAHMTIAGMTLGADYGTDLMNVTFGGTHALSFDASEYWNTVGWNMLHPLHYEFDFADADTLTAKVTSRPDWPNGACDYVFIISSKRNQ
jgi:hypothetical protein